MTGRKSMVPTFHEVLVAPELFGATFAGESWASWRVIAKAVDGVPLAAAEREMFASLTGGRRPPTGPVREPWFVKGRRVGGSLVASARAVYTGAFGSFASRLAPGERATVMLLSADRRQGRTLMRYCTGL